MARLTPPAQLAAGGLEWTRDGRWILFLQRNKEIDDLWRVSAEGGQPQRLDLAMPGLRDVRFHPDGKQIIFSAGQWAGEVWVMENFLPVLKASR